MQGSQVQSLVGELDPTCHNWDLVQWRMLGASLVAQMVNNLPAMQETWVRCLGGEDPLEKGMATHSSVLAWRIPWTEDPGGVRRVLEGTGGDRVRDDVCSSSE